MSDAVWMILAFFSTVLGMAWLALAMNVHWKQVLDAANGPSNTNAKLLRVLGSVALATSLMFCLFADVPTMAVLVWMMEMAFAAFIVASVLTWRPALLRPLSFGFREV